MVSGLDFVLYSLGSGIVMVSAAGALRLIFGITTNKKSRSPEPEAQPRAPIPVPDPGSDLEQRLLQFQSARYASPIVRRQLTDDVGPRPSQPPPTPQARPGTRTTGVPTQLRPAPLPLIKKKEKTDDKVLPFPVKMKKEEPPKEGA